MFVTIALKLIALFGGANAGALINGVTDVLKNKTNADVSKTLSANEQGQILGSKYFDSVDKANAAKAANRPMYLVVFGLVAFASPCAFLTWAATLDSMPLFGHVVGSWGIDIPPKLQVPFEKIIDSFFISAPIAATGIAIAQAFRK